MGRVKSKTTKNNHKKRNIVVAVVVAVILAVVLLMASNPHPGYSQLEKELDQITLPEGWSEVGPRTGEKDYWNMFCRDVTIDCPGLATVLRIDEGNNNVLKFFSESLARQGYTQKLVQYNCVDDVSQECRVELVKKDKEVTLTYKNIKEKPGYPRVYIQKSE